MKLDNWLCSDNSFLKKYSPGIYLLFLPESRATISNLTNHSIVETGFVVGIAPTDVSFVNVGFDDALPSRIPVINGSWRAQLPAQAVTNSFWTYGSLHTIYVQIPFEKPNTILVRKGTNKDTDGDGYPDLIVTAISVPGTQGYAFVYKSNPNTKQLDTTPNTVLTNGIVSDFFGCRIGAGDFNGDGYADILIGDQAYVGATGRVYEFLSRGQSGIPSQNLNSGGSADAILDGVVVGGRFGTNIASFDVNRDGFDDGVFASPWNDNLFTLQSQGSNGFVSQNTNASTFTYQSSDSAANFGNYATMGDVNGDGFLDLIVGEHQHSSFTGRIFIFVSNQGTFTSQPQQFLYPPTDPFPGCANAGGCKFGSSFVLDYFNSDHCIDLAVGGPNFDSNKGIVFVYHSTCDATNPYSNAPVTTLLGPPIASCNASSCFFGGNLASGDTNGDGLPDLLIAAPGASSGIGDVYLVLNDPTTGFPNLDLVAGGAANSLFSGNDFLSNFSMGLKFQDTNADGLQDIVISEPTTTNRVYSFHSVRGSVPASQNLNNTGVASQTLSPPVGTSLGNTIALWKKTMDSYLLALAIKTKQIIGWI